MSSTNGPKNPYVQPLASVPPAPAVESSEEEHFIVRDPDGTAHVIGTQRETVILDPTTGERHFIKTRELMRSSDNRLLLNPGEDQVFRCDECGAQSVSHYSVKICAGCFLPRHAACMHALDEQTYLCKACFKHYRLRRFIQWIFSLIR
jgi:hypothetical protein